MYENMTKGQALAIHEMVTKRAVGGGGRTLKESW